MKKKYELSNVQAKNLLSFILMAIVFKNIKSDDIIYENNHIQRILGINFEKGKILFDSDIVSNDFSSNINDLLNKNKMIDNWSKFLDSLKKKKKI